MAFTIIDAPQRSPEWLQARSGRLTGSAAKDMLAKGRGREEAIGRRKLRFRLAAERFMGDSRESTYSNEAMRWGQDVEPDAFAAYEAFTGNVVRRTGFLAHDEVMAGCSLDGDIDNFTGIIELKCPKSHTHLRYLRTGNISKYKPQIMHNLWISGAQWCDFASYDPRYPDHMRLFVKRILREELDIVGYEISARAFLTEVERELKALESYSA